MKKRNKKVKYDKGSKSQEHSKGGRDFLGLMLGMHVGGVGRAGEWVLRESHAMKKGAKEKKEQAYRAGAHQLLGMHCLWDAARTAGWSWWRRVSSLAELGLCSVDGPWAGKEWQCASGSQPQPQRGVRTRRRTEWEGFRGAAGADRE